MDKKTLLLIVALVAIPILVSVDVAEPKNDEREPITISFHSSYEMMSLDKLIIESDLIVMGNVGTVFTSRWNTPDGRRPGGDPAQRITPRDIIFTDLNFNVIQTIKGDTQRSSALIRSLGGVVDEDRMIAYDIVPEKDKTYLLFLYLDTVGLTANLVPGHYWITGGGFQGLYEIIGEKAISKKDEWLLEDLLAYIQKSLDSAAPLQPEAPAEVPTPVETNTPAP